MTSSGPDSARKHPQETNPEVLTPWRVQLKELFKTATPEDLKFAEQEIAITEEKLRMAEAIVEKATQAFVKPHSPEQITRAIVEKATRIYVKPNNAGDNDLN